MYRNEPAFPFVNRLAPTYEDADNRYGLNQIEIAALMIAPAVMAKFRDIDPKEIGRLSAEIAVAVLNAANRYEVYKQEDL
jgi:hypothetical protein